MSTYNIGPLTAAYVFQRSGLKNMSDMQAVMDAVEAALGQFYIAPERLKNMIRLEAINAAKGLPL